VVPGRALARGPSLSLANAAPLASQRSGQSGTATSRCRARLGGSGTAGTLRRPRVQATRWVSRRAFQSSPATAQNGLHRFNCSTAGASQSCPIATWYSSGDRHKTYRCRCERGRAGVWSAAAGIITLGADAAIPVCASGPTDDSARPPNQGVLASCLRERVGFANEYIIHTVLRTEFRIHRLSSAPDEGSMLAA
jgi:hypothetical protein